MASYEIKNWSEFQHYKDRNPPWIKLHFELLASEDWVTFTDTERVLAVACMLVASRSKGVIDASANGLRYLERVAYLNSPPDLNPLIDSGFLVLQADAGAVQANDTQEEEEEEETEKEGNTEFHREGECEFPPINDSNSKKKTGKQTPTQMIEDMAYTRDKRDELYVSFGRPPWTPQQITEAKRWLKPLPKYTEAELDQRRRNRKGRSEPTHIADIIPSAIGGQS